MNALLVPTLSELATGTGKALLFNCTEAVGPSSWLKAKYQSGSLHFCLRFACVAGSGSGQPSTITVFLILEDDFKKLGNYSETIRR
jgi:hypothetical protein